MKKRTKHARTQTDDKAERTAPQQGPPAPAPEQIRRRAYEIFEARGGEPGGELHDWLLAEQELKTAIERRKEKTD